MTFTDAATKELRERIRIRLAEAARFFRDESTADALIADLRDEYPPEQWPACATAWISPRNGWTKPPSRPSTVVPAHAARTRVRQWQPFTQTLETTTATCLAKYCATTALFCYPMHDDALNWVRNNWGGPAALMPRVRALFGSERPAMKPVSRRADHDCLQERLKR